MPVTHITLEIPGILPPGALPVNSENMSPSGKRFFVNSCATRDINPKS
ncbi:hypothetical protein ACVWY0_002472 [Arthrobacter sp. UYNi723]